MNCAEVILTITNTIIAGLAFFISFKTWRQSTFDQMKSRLLSLVDEYRSVEMGLSLERLFSIKELAEKNGITINAFYKLIIEKAEKHEKEKGTTYKERRELDATSIKVDRRRVSHFFSVVLYMLENNLLDRIELKSRFSFEVIDEVLEPLGIDEDKNLTKIKVLLDLDERKGKNRRHIENRQSMTANN